MASKWAPEDFIAPFGLFRPTMFPLEDDLTAKITTYLDDAEERCVALSGAALDAAVEAWVYHKGFLAAHVDYNAEAAINTIADQGGEEFTFSQIQQWKVLSDEYLAKFTNILASSEGKFTNGPRTEAVKNSYEW